MIAHVGNINITIIEETENMTDSLSSTLKSVNPATLEMIAEVPVTSPAAITEAVQTSREVFQSWQSTNLKERLKLIKNFRQLLIDKQDEVARLISLEVGKPLVESYLGEISGPLDTCLWLTKNAEKILATTEINPANPLMFGKKHYLKFEPAGVIGIIAPWNYPFSIPVMTILMALAAGNTVILKPSEKSPLTGIKIGELFRQAGFPENAVIIVTGDGRAGQALAGLGLDRLIFTGSVNTGESVIKTMAPNITPLTLELGGKDPAIVLPDAPVERTAQAIAWGAFTNAGQACASIERLYLVRGGNSEAILNRLIELASKLKLGDPLLETTEIGPLIDVEQYDHVVNQVEQAIALGAKVLCGAGNLSSLDLNTDPADRTHSGDTKSSAACPSHSNPANDNGTHFAESSTAHNKDNNSHHHKKAVGCKKLAGYFYQPTIITNVNNDMKLMQEETFGPILPVVMVDSMDEAINLANQSIYGLTASVWSSNIKQAKLVADKLEAGSVFINDCLYSHALPELPWGGLKKSGFGRSHSQYGLLDLVNIKQVNIDQTLNWHRLWWYPYQAKKLQAARSGLQLLHDNHRHKGWIIGKLSRLFEFIVGILSIK